MNRRAAALHARVRRLVTNDAPQVPNGFDLHQQDWLASADSGRDSSGAADPKVPRKGRVGGAPCDTARFPASSST
jgi:hypothetical protein